MPFYAEYVSQKHTINSSLQLDKIQETYTNAFHLFYCISVPQKQNEFLYEPWHFLTSSTYSTAMFVSTIMFLAYKRSDVCVRLHAWT
jgi:hypothetical protein